MMADTGTMQMRGTEDIDITIQQNAAVWGTEHIRRVMVGSRWKFFVDGRCLFIEGPSASARDDLYPLPGRWKSDGTIVRVDLGRSTDSRVTVRLEGAISANGVEPLGDNATVAELQVTYTTWSPFGERRLVIRQSLVADHETRTPPLQDGGIVVARLDADPLTYAVTLSGHDGVRGFVDIRTELVFRPAPASDRGPVRFSLGADSVDVIGGIVWMSHLDGDDSLRTYDSTITMSGDNLSAYYHHKGVSIAVTWLRASLPFLPSAPVTATRANLNLTFTGRTIRGNVQADGAVPSSPIHYRADLVGEWVDPADTFNADLWQAPGCG